MTQKQGVTTVLTGDGKGKTTAALGMALRALGHGFRVCVIQFLKTSKRYGELASAQHFPGLEIIQTGADCPRLQNQKEKSLADLRQMQACDDCLECHVNPNSPRKEDIAAAQRGWALALEKASATDLLILDEIIYAVNFDLLPLAEVLEFLTRKPAGLDVVLTGRNAPQKLIAAADTVTDMHEIKHHYQRGFPARAGMEY